MPAYGDIMDPLSAAIHAERVRRGWSQQQLATTAGVTRQFVGRVEKGHPGAEIGLLTRLLTALNLTVEVRRAPAYASVSDYLDDLLGGPDA